MNRLIHLQYVAAFSTKMLYISSALRCRNHTGYLWRKQLLSKGIWVVQREDYADSYMCRSANGISSCSKTVICCSYACRYEFLKEEVDEFLKEEVLI